MALPFILIGNPENRRVTLFQAALAAQGLAPARVVPWIEVIRDVGALERLGDEPALVRIDSFGESFAVERALLLRGFDSACEAGVATLPPTELAALVEDRGRILAPRQHHLGFLRVLEDIDHVFASRPAWLVLNPVASIVELFDKRVTSRMYSARGIPVPRALEGVGTPDDLRTVMARDGVDAVYVKLSCSSSASCLAIFEAPTASAPHGALRTTIEIAEAGWYNSRRVRRYVEPMRVDAILEFLLREGSQVEESVPKARLDGAFFDCRVLVVAGEPAFTVARTSAHPITNLHLGGKRGDLTRMMAIIPEAVRSAAMRSCHEVHRAHGAPLHVGVDLLYEADRRGHRVVEANAFGDLLPNLAREGLSVYEWEIRAALALTEGR